MAPPIDVSRFEQLKASGDLPSPKGVALAVMRLTQQEDVSIANLANVIKTDPAFVGRLIKAANGIVGYGRRPVASVQDALTVLGLPAVRNMALGFSLLTHYRSGVCEGFDYGRYWAESLLSAVSMQAITLRTRAAAADEMYCLGLLARVGEIALATLYPHDYSRIVKEAGGQDLHRLLELESHAFAMTNAELGAAMLADWGLPRIFTDAAHCVASSTESTQSEGQREYVVTQSLALSQQVAKYCLGAEQERPQHKHRLLIAASRLNFDEETFGTLTDGVAREWLEWGALLSIHAEVLPPFGSVKALAPELGADGAEEEVPRQDVSMRALIVDTDVAACQTIAQFLGENGFQTSFTHDGFSAAELALDFMPDMMLIGEGLPDMSGGELVRVIRKTRIGRALYILILAEDVQEEVVVQALEAGADDALPKPVNLRVLLAKLGASRRLTDLNREIEQDREEIRHFAAELAVSNRRLQDAAMTDPLTGFPNRRCFSERFAQEWAFSLRNKRPLSCILVDVDHFKGINDTYGHDVGDAVLVQVAQAIRAAVRTQDVLARLGGDEFVVLCPGTAIESAMVCAERIRKAMHDLIMDTRLRSVKISISAGVACRDATMTDADSLFKRSDDGLYLAKKKGRDQVATAQLPQGRPGGSSAAGA
ncbi:GGDEF domain-containing response regulator [Uliginosibacterium gangwonense]|uniref:GGDEF domain-containing response regulator n=1 Tax=Uliginosibacterium gangwonense TaxID=392736 RepID=UPI00036EEF68|nr:diguanylate cyclase [Uliginosibacterium gangwonense]